MCIIAVKPAGKPMFSDATIKQMFSRNHDGAGIMWAENNLVHFQKGFMTVDKILDFVHSRSWDDLPAVLHFRIGTAGPNNGMNCHPYPIRMKNCLSGTCELAMAHNGVLYDYNPPLGSKINDTQVFVNDVLNNLPKTFLKNKSICHLISKDIGTSRLAFLDKNGKITRFGQWIKEDEYYFSNDSFRIPQYYTGYSFNDDCALSGLRLRNDLGARLSFNKDFVNGVCMFPNITKFQDAVDELESKTSCIDDELYEDGVYYYTVSVKDYSIWRDFIL